MLIPIPIRVERSLVGWSIGWQSRTRLKWLNTHTNTILFGNSYYCSVTQFCPTLCDSTDSSTPEFPVVLQYLPEFAQTHVHWVGDATQPSHPLSAPSPPVFSLAKNQVFSNELSLCIRWPKYWRFSFSISPSTEYSGLISFRTDCFELIAVKETQESPPATKAWKHQFFSAQSSLWSNSYYWKNHSFD